MVMRSWLEEYQKKVIHPDNISAKVTQIRDDGLTIATLNGSFDLLHAGHLQIIFEASQVADILIMALNSDQSIQQYKSANRPIIPLESRLQMISALQFVDYATWFDETDPIKILSLIKPDVHVNGSEYGENCIEAETIKENGGKLHLVSLIPGLSTTGILDKIRT